MKAIKKNLKEKLRRRFARDSKKRVAIQQVALATFAILFAMPIFYYVIR